MISSFMASIGNHYEVEPEEDLLRHMILNSIRANYLKFKNTYGQLIIASDHTKSWRRDIFPYYKAARRKAREKSELNWAAIFMVLDKLRTELKENFPYPLIQIEGAEADDIIGSLVLTKPEEPTMILSGDKDFAQLQTNINIHQFDPVRKREIKMSPQEAEMSLREHIIRGDTSDGIPNILSNDNCFVIGQRQRPLQKKKVEGWVAAERPEDFCDEYMLRNWYRNQTLIDLSKTPADLMTKVVEDYQSQLDKSPHKMMHYLVKHRLHELADALSDFG